MSPLVKAALIGIVLSVILSGMGVRLAAFAGSDALRTAPLERPHQAPRRVCLDSRGRSLMGEAYQSGAIAARFSISAAQRASSSLSLVGT